MSENNTTTLEVPAAPATPTKADEKNILSSVPVSGFPGVKRNTSTAIESKGKKEESSAPFDWYEFSRDLSLSDVAEFFRLGLPEKERKASPVPFLIDTIESALKTTNMNKARTALKRARLNKIDPMIEKQIQELSALKLAAKPGSKKAAMVQSTIDSIMADLNAKLAAMSDEDEVQE